MMPCDNLEPGIGVGLEYGIKPRALDMSGTTEARVARVYHDQQEIPAPQPVAQAILSGRSVARYIREYLAPDTLRIGIRRIVVAGAMIDRNAICVVPAHLLAQPVIPLLLKGLLLGVCPHDMVTEEDDEVGLRVQVLKGCIDTRKIRFKGPPGKS